MARDDSDILKSIIASGGGSNNPRVEKAGYELAALQQRKADIAAAVKPSVMAPKLGTDALGVSTDSVEAKIVAKDISEIKISQKKLLSVSTDSRTILSNILRTSSSYYENNNELLNRLLLDFSPNKNESQRMGGGGFAASGGGSAAGLGVPETPPDPGSEGGGGFGGFFGRGFKGGGGGGGGGKPKVKTSGPPGGKKPGVLKSIGQGALDAGKTIGKGVLKAGKIGGLIAAAAALGVGAMSVLAYINADSDEEKQKILDGLGLSEENIAAFNAVMSEYGIPVAIGVSAIAAPIAASLAQSAFGRKPELGEGGDFDTKPKPSPAADADSRPPPQKPKPKVPKFRVEGDDLYSKNTGKMLTGAAKEAAKEAIERKTKAEIAEAVGKTIAKKGLGSVLKKIPLVGLAAGLFFAADRAMAGDLTGATMELGSGAASLVPGVGTAGSIAIDIGSMVRDTYHSLYEKYPTVPFDDETKQNVDEITGMITDQIQSLMPTDPPVIADNKPSPLNNIASSKGQSRTQPAAPKAATPEAPKAITTGPQGQKLVRNVAGKVGYGAGRGFIEVPGGVIESEVSAAAKPSRQQELNRDRQEGGTTIIKQGDTVNNINNNSAGGGSGGGTTSAAANRDSWDDSLYGGAGIGIY